MTSRIKPIYERLLKLGSIHNYEATATGLGEQASRIIAASLIDKPEPHVFLAMALAAGVVNGGFMHAADEAPILWSPEAHDAMTKAVAFNKAVVAAQEEFLAIMEGK